MTENDIEKKARAKMTGHRWKFWFPPRSWGRERDIFGVFDLVAIRPEGFLFVQLTSVQHITDREKKILAWVRGNGVKLPSGSVEVWGWDKNRSKFIVKSFFHEKKTS